MLSQNQKIIAENLAAPKENLVTIYGYDPESTALNTVMKSKDNAKDQALSDITSAIESLQFKEITKIDITDRLDIKLTYKKVTIKLGGSSDLAYKIKFAKTIIEGKNFSADFEGEIIMRNTGEASVIEKKSGDSSSLAG